LLISSYGYFGDLQEDLEYRYAALREMRMELLNKFYFSNGRHKPFTCLLIGCGKDIKKPREYLRHVAAQWFPVHLGWDVANKTRNPQYSSSLPLEMEEALTATEQGFCITWQKFQEDLSQMKKVWGTPRSMKRHSYRKAFLPLLKNDIPVQSHTN
jgi:hypothetical protein